MAAVSPVEIVSKATLDEILAIETEREKLKQREASVEREFSSHRDRLFLYQDETYAQSSCSFGWGDERFTVYGCRVSKTRPWETTSDTVHAPISEITYLNDTLANRKAKVKGLQEGANL
ncbi:hypothetical protein J8F10_24335 [Gemmata sp. G18]|uniref:Uncharacterized protein n=1 Tax=Gemmata palustris TaxID=2822762 RepID=A0ABS5BXC1_9BACT|nr:hypothetical protein [Gemmata palustris]MBP3958390.1 hypothetical protein [Gemmata palustris]